MSDERPLSLEEVLAAEYGALRPEAGFERAGTDALFRKAHGQGQPFSALCISGGGIRSATFALGAIQALAERRVLDQFDYLSTVSGGGYIGSWLTAWSHRAGGLAAVAPHLRRDAPAPEPGKPDPIGHLRDYNSYLSPRLGAMSADTWTLAATALRNVLLNWMVLVPLLLAALMVPRLYVSLLAFPELLYGEVIFGGATPNYGAAELDAISGSPLVRYALPFLCALLFAAALYNTLRYLPGVGNEDHRRSDFVLKVLLPLVGAVLGFLAFDSLFYLGTSFTDQSSLPGLLLATMSPCAMAWLAFLLFHPGGSRPRLQRLFGPLSLAIFFMAAGAGAATWASANFLLWSPNPDSALSWPAYATVAPPAILLGYVLGSFLFVGLSSRHLKDEDREWMSRSAAAVLMFCAAWLLACGTVLIAPRWAFAWDSWVPQALLAAGLAGGAVIVAEGSRPANAAGTSGAKTGTAAASALVLKLAPVLFALAFAIGCAVLTNLLLASLHRLPGLGLMPAMEILAADGSRVSWQDHDAVVSRSSLALLGTLLLALLALGWIMARYVNINTFSLHGMYRDRLIRAYLGASNPKRNASRFTGFAPSDDIAMHALDPRSRPLHVINLALNLVQANRLAWQQRKAQSFTVTPLHCGSFDLGYRSSARYGGPHGISLGTAMAISGAAASPNMGYHSNPVVGFIMTLLNARLGCWLGNPGAAGARTWTRASPRSAVRSLVKEAVGMTSNLGEYIYLSDGGHFENLALYEMVLRRCRYIVALDAGCDPAFAYEDLGNALRKIRIDLRIPISFADGQLRPLRERRRRCALGRIGYSAVDPGAADGWLIYIKPMRLGTEPPDVDNYGAMHPEFPHQSTGDQWFDESQTESYRMLGLTTIDEILRGWDGGSMEDLRRHVESVYLGPRDAAGGPASLRSRPPE
jgi:hypothetical protein